MVRRGSTVRVRQRACLLASAQTPASSEWAMGYATGAVPVNLTCDFMVTYRDGVTDDDRAFKALADPTRRFLLDLLFTRDGRTLTELEPELEMTRFGVMKHLKVLA